MSKKEYYLRIGVGMFIYLGTVFFSAGLFAFFIERSIFLGLVSFIIGVMASIVAALMSYDHLVHPWATSEGDDDGTSPV